MAAAVIERIRARRVAVDGVVRTYVCVVEVRVRRPWWSPRRRLQTVAWLECEEKDGTVRHLGAVVLP